MEEAFLYINFPVADILLVKQTNLGLLIMIRRWRRKKETKKMKELQRLTAALTEINEELNGKGPFELSYDVDENVKMLQTLYADCYDVVFHPFYIGGQQKAVFIYIEGLTNVEEVNEHLLAPLMSESLSKKREDELAQLTRFAAKKIPFANVKEITTLSDCVKEIATGRPVLLIDRKKSAFSFNLLKREKRSIEEPVAESVVRGPREGFIESLNVNTSLLRQRIKSHRLKMVLLQVGRYTKTDVVIVYVEGLADQTLVEEAKRRLQRIEIDGIIDSGYIEDLIEDYPFSPFPQVLTTERPDVVAANLLEGRVAIFTDGSPFALVVPTTLFSLLQSPEDYYSRFLIGTAIRWLRYLFFAISLLLPSLYVAVLTFHQEMIPTTLLIRAAASREQIPFPALVEAIMMEVTFEALREAGTRLPKQIGPAVSIVGALVIGEAAVSAGIISAPMVMVVAITGIASFSVPRYNVAIAFRMLRFPMMFLAGTLGLLGIMLGIIAIVVHLCTLRSFGVPYLSPMAPTKQRDMRDVLIRAPWWMFRTRPHLTGDYDKFRQAPGQKPDPAKGSEK
ncbi:spore germination protein [Bacillaceae bacterium]